MKKLLTLILSCIAVIAVKAQTAAVPTVDPYGKVSQADLDLKKCDFEPDANAEVLFDYGVMDGKAGLPMGHRTRIKIFNEHGKGYGSIELEYYSYQGEIGIADIKGETINYENGKTEITPLDKKDIYNVRVDKWHSMIKFAMPDVKAGSIIEFTYRQLIPAAWHFQYYLPTRYSEYELNITGNPNFKTVPYVKQPYVKSKGEPIDPYQIRAMANIHSMPNEPYIGSRVDNLQRVEFVGINTRISTWPKIGELMIKASDFGYDLDRNLSGESAIIAKAKTLQSADEKIAFIFDTVKNRMKWDGNMNFYTIDGTVKAWDQKTGNSTEINMMVYHLLKKAGIKASPLVISTKSKGKINPANPSIFAFNSTAIFVPVDSTKNYVLDATNKYALYNTMPENILNSFGFNIDPHDALSINLSDNLKAYNVMFISDEEPAMQSIYLNAEIKPDGKMDGNAEITSSKYNKAHALQLYETKGPEKYLDTFKNFDNNLKIISYKRENTDVDSLPLVQKVDFSFALAGSDENYIYV
ncbi:MAG TPA: DUF3857 domain-containing protein, partial [Mucilaginibacter sp.]|nr:DUF3857 domain-containing protein [Mucilaginibacter sp.]